MAIHFVVHDEGDSVGVVVVEGLKSGTRLNGWIMDQDKMIEFDAKSDIPIGHKLAIKPIKSQLSQMSNYPLRPRAPQPTTRVNFTAAIRLIE
ncbi:hypothetical protein [Falsiroseomonas sp.]|uniref:hypothetical protein n=1 Tax=Falsiroseomonas sp. TaxID=2870721 RepID=UPI003564665D